MCVGDQIEHLAENSVGRVHCRAASPKRPRQQSKTSRWAVPVDDCDQ